MFLRKGLATVLGASLLLAGLATSGGAAAEEVSFGTLAPKQSPWGKVFDAWSKAVDKKSKGKLSVKWYYNGAQGDEGAMIAKIRAGQLDGAASTSVGMSIAYKPILALQMPGLFKDWATLDKARNAMMPEFQAGLKEAGFVMLGTGDVGLARTLSKGHAIKTPDDLKQMKVYRWKDDPIGPVVASVIGYNSVPSSVPGLLPALSSGRINTITVPALASTQLQWWSHVDHMTDEVAGVGIGGLMMSTKRLDALPGDMRELLSSTGKKAGGMLTERIRKEDDKAYKMLKGRLKVVSLTAGESKIWKTKFSEVRTRLGQGVFAPALIHKLENLAGLGR